MAQSSCWAPGRSGRARGIRAVDWLFLNDAVSLPACLARKHFAALHNNTAAEAWLVIHGTAAPRALAHRFVTGARLVHVRSPTSLRPIV